MPGFGSLTHENRGWGTSSWVGSVWYSHVRRVGDIVAAIMLPQSMVANRMEVSGRSIIILELLFGVLCSAKLVERVRIKKCGTKFFQYFGGIVGWISNTNYRKLHTNWRIGPMGPMGLIELMGLIGLIELMGLGLIGPMGLMGDNRVG